MSDKTPEEEPKELRMSFEPSTIEHLGVKMYSTLPPALAEMIANSYDACAKKVSIKIYDEKENKKIIIQDDGIGMSFDEVNQYFLRIGRNRRSEGLKETNCERTATGKKGLGKLALFGIGDRIIIETVQDYKGTKFILDWNEITHWTGTYYTPKHELFDSKEESGTIITLEKLKRKTAYDLDALTNSLAMLFNFSAKDFDLEVSLNDSEPIKIDSKLKYKNIIAEFEWGYKDIAKDVKSDYEYKNNIEGTILTTEKPLKPGLRGITLFSNGRMINSPEFFGQSESSHFFSYTTGWLNVDFVDNWTEDLISTNRQSIEWDNEKTILLREFLRECLSTLERKWRAKRKEKRNENVQTKAKVDIPKWYGTLPEKIEEKVKQVVTVLDESELSEENQALTVQAIHELIPEYPNFHWRYIHPEVQKVSEQYYKDKNYYTAFLESVKRYVNEVRKKSGSVNSSERSMMGEVFSNRKLSTTKKYKKTDGTNFSNDTIKNIEEGQHFLSEGVYIGGRHPIAHEEIEQLSKTGLFSEKDCLDFLGLLSHLFRRLDDSEAP